MRHFIILLRHEIRMLLVSPATYVAAVLFLALMGGLYWAILRGMVNTPEDVKPTVQFFSLFWIPVFFVVPLLTMRGIAGERNLGTLDTLMTTPVTRGAMILAKFFGAYLFYLGLWALTLAFPLITWQLHPNAADSGALLAPAPLAGSFVFLAVSGVLFVAIGIFASSLTRSQLVSAMLTFTALFLVIVGGQQLHNVSATAQDWGPWATGLTDYLQIFRHLEDFSRGILDTRPFAYYLSTGALLLALASLVIEAKA